MANEVKIKATLDESGVTKGAKQIRDDLERVKEADGKLDWQGVKSGEQAAKGLGDGFTVAKGIVANLATQGISLAIGAAKDFAATVVEVGQTFETSMSKVSALSGATGDELATLEGKARELGATTTFSASEAADALGYMALAGWDTQEMLSGVNSVLTLAQAGELDLAAASDLVTDYLSAFGMTADDTARMVDVLAYAQANANTTVEGLGMAYKNCAANAHAAGLDIETTTSLISMMANQGLKGAEAGTALNAVMRDMTAQMEDGAIKIGETSVAVMDAEGNYRDFVAILADVEAATNGMGDAEKSAALQATFTADSIKGLNLLLNAGTEEASLFRDELYNCAGTAEATAATMTDNLGGDLAALNSALEEFALKIYDSLQAPLREAAQTVTNTVIPAATLLIENLDKVAPIAAGVALGLAAIKAKSAVFDPAVKSAKTFAETLTKCKVITNAAGTTLIKYNAQTKALTTQLVASERAARTQAAAIRAQEVAAKASAAATRVLGTALKTIAPIAAMTVLVEIVTAISTSMQAAAERSEAYTKATDGLTSAQQTFYRSLDSASGTLQDAAEGAEAYVMSLDEVRTEVDAVIEANGQLADALTDIYSAAGYSVGMLDEYRAVVDELAGRSDLGAADIARLEMAVKGVNDACGTSYTVIKDEAGAYQVMGDEAVIAKDKVLELIDAQQLQIQLEANREAATEAYKRKKDAIQAAADAQKTYNDAEAAYNSLLEANNGVITELDACTLNTVRTYEEARSALEDANGALDSVTQAYDAATDAAVLLQMAQDSASGSVSRAVAGNLTLTSALQSAQKSTSDFAADLEAVGVKGEDLADVQQDVAARIAEAYDGTYASVAEILKENGIAVDENKAAVQSALEEMSLSLAQMGDVSEAELAELQAGFENGLQGVAQVCISQGRGIPASLASAIKEQSGLPEAEAQVMLDALVLQLAGGDVEAAAELLGHAVDEGLLNGIASGADLPPEAAAQLSQDVIDRAKTELDSHSPSREFVDVGTTIPQGLTVGIAGAAGEALATMGGLCQSLISTADGIPSAFEARGQSASAGLASGLMCCIDGIAANASALAVTAESGVSPLPSKLGSAAETASSRFAALLTSAQGTAASNSALMASTTDVISELQSKAMGWGRGVGSNFAAGIHDKIGAVGEACTALANKAMAILGHSVAKEGPFHVGGKGEAAWGSHAIENFADGAERAESYLSQKLESVAERAKSALTNMDLVPSLSSLDWSMANGVFNGLTALGLSGAAATFNAKSLSSTVTNSTQEVQVKQEINFNQPIKSPYQTVRMLERYERFGLAGSRQR